MQKVSSKDLWQLENITDLKSYHKRLIFTLIKANPDQKENDYLYSLATLENGQIKRLATFEQEINFVLIDISHALFVVDNILQEIDLNTGLIKQLHRFANQIQLSLVQALPQGRLLLSGVYCLQAAEKDYQVIDELPSHFNGLGVINKQRQHLFSFDLKTKKLHDLLRDQYFHVHDFFVNTKAEEIYLAGDSYQHKRPVIPSLYRIDLQTQKLECIMGSGEFDVSTSLFYNQMFFLHNQPYLLGNDDPQLLNKNPQFYRLTPTKERKLVAAWDHSLGCWVGSDQAMGRGNVSQVFAEQYYFLSTIVDHAEIFRFDGQQVKSYFKFSGSINAFTFVGPDQFYFVGQAADELEKLFYYDQGQVSVVFDPNAQFLAAKYVAQTKQVDYLACDQSKQHGWILFPQDYQPDKRYPAILEIHGGPKTAFGPVFHHEMQLFASHGYFVFFCNIHGSDGQGNAFSNISGHWGEKDYQDLMLFTDEVLRQFPAIDPQRLGVAGGSYGGFMTNWIIGHTHRFAAACSQRSIASEISHAYLSDIGPDDNLFENQATIDQNPEIFWKHSPLKYADQVKTPTLFIHSDQDFRCPLLEGMQMLHALLWHGVAARMCLFHGENHELSRSGKPAHRIRRLDEMLNWFNYYLK